MELSEGFDSFKLPGNILKDQKKTKMWIVLALHIFWVSSGLLKHEKCNRKCNLTPYKPMIHSLILYMPTDYLFTRGFYIVIQQKVRFNSRFLWETYCTCFHIPSILKAWQMDFCFPLSQDSIFCILTTFPLIFHIGIICSVPLLFLNRFFCLPPCWCLNLYLQPLFLSLCIPCHATIHGIIPTIICMQYSQSKHNSALATRMQALNATACPLSGFISKSGIYQASSLASPDIILAHIRDRRLGYSKWKAPFRLLHALVLVVL